MSLLERIKRLFSRTQLPEETQLLLSGVADVQELLAGLDDITTRNEVEARTIEREIEKLSRMETSHKERVTAGQLIEREKLSTLREIQRLRRRMDSLEKRHRIHQDNIDLHLGLFDRISEMQAMELKRVNQQQIEEIAVDYEEKLEKHRDIITAARAADGMEPSRYEDSVEKQALAALEREILAEAGLDKASQEKAAQEKAKPEQAGPEKAGPEQARPEAEPEESSPAPDRPAEEEEQDVEEAAPRALEGDGAGAPSQPPRRRSLDEELAELEAREAQRGGERTLEVE